MHALVNKIQTIYCKKYLRDIFRQNENKNQQFMDVVYSAFEIIDP